jgi:hypothetical protein
MSEYSFKIERYLTPADVALLRREHFIKLQELSTRYVPEVDLAKGLPAKPEYLDVVRTSCLLMPSLKVASVLRSDFFYLNCSK